MRKEYVKKIIGRLMAGQDAGAVPSVGDILPARIIRKTGPNRYLVEMRRRRLHVESALAFAAGEVYVQIQALAPRMRLRLLSAHRELLPRMIEIARAEKIFLDDFNQWCLAELMRSRYSFALRDTAGDVEKIRELARSLQRTHLISLACYVRMLARTPQVFAAAAAILQSKAVDLQLPVSEADSSQPETYVRMYAACWRTCQLGGRGLLRCDQPEPELEQISRLLPELQVFLDPGHTLQAFLVPAGARSRLVAVEHRRGGAGAEGIDRYHMQLRLSGHPPVSIAARVLGNDVRIRLTYPDASLAALLRQLEQPLRRLAAAWHKNLLPVQHEISPPQPLLPAARGME